MAMDAQGTAHIMHTFQTIHPLISLKLALHFTLPNKSYQTYPVIFEEALQEFARILQHGLPRLPVVINLHTRLVPSHLTDRENAAFLLGFHTVAR